MEPDKDPPIPDLSQHPGLAAPEEGNTRAKRHGVYSIESGRADPAPEIAETIAALRNGIMNDLGIAPGDGSVVVPENAGMLASLAEWASAPTRPPLVSPQGMTSPFGATRGWCASPASR